MPLIEQVFAGQPVHMDDITLTLTSERASAIATRRMWWPWSDREIASVAMAVPMSRMPGAKRSDRRSSMGTMSSEGGGDGE